MSWCCFSPVRQPGDDNREKAAAPVPVQPLASQTTAAAQTAQACDVYLQQETSPMLPPARITPTTASATVSADALARASLVHADSSFVSAQGSLAGDLQPPNGGSTQFETSSAAGFQALHADLKTPSTSHAELSNTPILPPQPSSPAAAAHQAASAPAASSLTASNLAARFRGNARVSTSSVSSRASSVAMLLGVEDFAAADMEVPHETGLLPLAAFDDMSTEEFEIAMAEQQQANLLFLSPRVPKAMLRQRWSLEDYVLQKHMHQGYIADVVDARCKKSNLRVALKVYSLPEMSELERVQLLREIRLHGRMSHPYVITVYSAFMEQGIHSSQLGRAKYNHVVLVEEFADGGDLLGMMMRHGGRLNEAVAVNEVLRPLLAALVHLHAQGIVHRDLKPGNVLFDLRGTLKLADFGLALDLNEERANTRAGTLEFMAPEVLSCPAKSQPNENKDGQAGPGQEYTTTADSWAVGALLYSIICGRPPFRGQNNKEVAKKIMKDDAVLDLVFPDRMSNLARDFVTCCMCKDPADRPTVLELQEHALLALTRSSTVSPAPSAWLSKPTFPQGPPAAPPLYPSTGGPLGSPVAIPSPTSATAASFPLGFPPAAPSPPSPGVFSPGQLGAPSQHAGGSALSMASVAASLPKASHNI
ncbi:kinase-like domain-containing protein [Haematococcus lacustris]